MSQTIKIAACQMSPRLGDVPYNLQQAQELIEEGFAKGAEWVILPEFFTTGMGYHRSMIDGSLPFNGPALNLLIESAKKHKGYAGGSFIAIKGVDRYNTFVLARPDGTYATHDKDIPTLWEHCYYRGGSDEGIMEAENVKVGAVLCWEFIRWQTARRLIGKVDMVIGGSAWWGYPKARVFKKYNALFQQMVHKTPSLFARLLGVPVAYAGCAGSFTCDMPYLPIPYRSYYLGETQIADGTGKILARLAKEDGRGVIIAEIAPGYVGKSEPLKDDFWIPKLPLTSKLAWKVYNDHGRRYYRKMKRNGWTV